jgi:hypothetical protein
MLQIRCSTKKYVQDCPECNQCVFQLLVTKQCILSSVLQYGAGVILHIQIVTRPTCHRRRYNIVKHLYDGRLHGSGFFKII